MVETDTLRALTDREFAADLQRRLYALVRAYELCDRSCLQNCSVTVAQSYALLALPAAAVSMNELSQAMGLAGSTMTRVVDELVQKELVTRGPDDEDRRIVRVQLTEHGRQVQGQIRSTLDHAFARVIEEIPPETRDVLLRVLGQLTEAVSAVARQCAADKAGSSSTSARP
jgi:DNA-binding MarR family transcriptional regulator